MKVISTFLSLLTLGTVASFLPVSLYLESQLEERRVAARGNHTRKIATPEQN
jgi:hypothetical protein